MLMQSCIGDEALLFRTSLKTLSLGFIVHRTAKNVLQTQWHGSRIMLSSHNDLINMHQWIACKIYHPIVSSKEGRAMNIKCSPFLLIYLFFVIPRASIRTCAIWGIWVLEALAMSNIWEGIWVLVSFIDMSMDLA